ncbi:hypothetical protein CC80DRAFT_490712 [Byssothecium circinans]|uniref:Uncharacterized protein n=1 Tax=Byssothecium circinans TaxID=147558 RepID=A0A6A5U2Q3_9PLEO|nr:hypothetical protein CC80DRAFT_490712 [Byssothecium circinans]
MYTADWLMKQLDLVEKHIWDISLGDTASSDLQTRLSELPTRFAVGISLMNTMRELRNPVPLSTMKTEQVNSSRMSTEA